MNDNQAPPIAEPDFDPHRDGRRGFMFGAICMAVVIGLMWWLA